MRLLSRFLVHTPARFLEDEYSISYTTILRIDNEVLENDIPKPKMQNVQGVLVDEKFLGSIQGFVTVCLDATTSEQFNEVMNGIRYRLNSARIESTNAAIKRISQSVWPVRCELSILETAPSLLSATPKKPQNRAFFLSADLKQTRKSALYAIFLLRIRGCDVLIWIRRYDGTGGLRDDAPGTGAVKSIE